MTIEIQQDTIIGWGCSFDNNRPPTEPNIVGIPETIFDFRGKWYAEESEDVYNKFPKIKHEAFFYNGEKLASFGNLIADLESLAYGTTDVVEVIKYHG